MATEPQEIKGALQTALESVQGIPQISWPGKPFKPVVGTPYVEGTITFQTRRPATMGDDRLVRYDGIMTANIVWPAGKGTGDPDVLAHRIVQTFMAGKNHRYGDMVVSCEYCEQGQPLDAPDWVRVPVVTKWFTHVSEVLEQ